MPTIEELKPFITEPREDLNAEYKGWLDLTQNAGKATVAKAGIALANHGGGFLIIGFAEEGGALISRPRPADMPEITQDAVNAAIERFVEPSFHCEVYNVPHLTTDVVHPVVVVPGNLLAPAMSTRDCEGTIIRNRCYIRKPGPKSQEITEAAEWRALFGRCIRAGREDMLESIRAIVTGRVLPTEAPDAVAELVAFCDCGRERWTSLTKDLPGNTPARMPHGHYEMGFRLVGAVPAPSLTALKERLGQARSVRLTGWMPFLELHRGPWEPYVHDDFVEAWTGRPSEDGTLRSSPVEADFWRADRHGHLYTVRGYMEDGSSKVAPGKMIDVALPIWRVGEGLLFAHRLARAFEGVREIAICCRFTGLAGRRLDSLDSFDGWRWISDHGVSQSSEVELRAVVTPQQVQDNDIEIMHQLLTPLYERFSFFALSRELVEHEMTNLKQRRF